jgi:hypothetical protein
MSNEKVELNTFPSTKSEALTMLYLQHQDLSLYTPEDLVVLYRDTLDRVRQQFSVVRKNS